MERLSCDLLEAFGAGPYGDWLDQSVLQDACGKLLQLGLVKCAVGVGVGHVDGIHGEL